MKRLRDKLRKDLRTRHLISGLNIVENDDHTFDIYEGLEFLEGDLRSWEDVVNYCKFLADGYIQYTPRTKYMQNRDEAIIYNNDKLAKNLKNLIEDKVNITPVFHEEKYLLAIYKDGSKASELVKKYHLDELIPEKPIDYAPAEYFPQIHLDRWANSRYQGGVPYNDWAGDSPFDEYGEVYEDLDIKDLDDEI